MVNRAGHWNKIYAKRQPGEVSWFQPHLEKSLSLINAARLPSDARIIDVGGGASTLASDLLSLGFSDITVLDVSSEGLCRAKSEMGEEAGRVKWIEDDVLLAELPLDHYGLWHDRAVFHFLMAEEEQAAYMKKMAGSLKSGGIFIIGGFALDGPSQCSGLPAARHCGASIGRLLGASFATLQEAFETHCTPSGSQQRFFFCSFRKK